MNLQFLVVDDFYEDPSAVRDLALQAEYRKDQNTPNLTSLKRFAVPEVYDVFSKILGFQVSDSGLDFSARFRVTMGGTPRPRDIHTDHPLWNAIIYLNPPSQCQGGTSLWRHRKTRWEGIPSDGEARAAGFAGLHEAMDAIGKEGVNRSLWEETIRIPMKYNRLVLIRSTLFHSSFDDFGSAIEDARMVQTFFLNPAQ